MLPQRTSFPYIVGALTIALAVFVAFAVTHRPQAPADSSSSPTQAERLSDASYQSEMKGILLSFDADYPKAKNDIARLVLVEATLNKVLSVRVPESDKAFHLEIAIALNEWREGLRGDAAALAAGKKRYADAEASATWLK